MAMFWANSFPKKQHRVYHGALLLTLLVILYPFIYQKKKKQKFPKETIIEVSFLIRNFDVEHS